MYKINKSWSEYLTAIKLALANLKLNKTRAFLSVAGIVIGVVSVIIVVSAGKAVQGYVIGMIQTFGTDLIEIQAQNPKSKAGGQSLTPPTTFKLSDAKTLAKDKRIQGWYAAQIGQQVMSYESENKSVMIFGTTQGYFQIDQQAKFAQGAPYLEEDDDGLSQVVIIGSKIKDDLFGAQDAIGKIVKIKGKSFKVIGVLKERGTMAFFDFDTIVYMPLQTLQKKVLGLDYISVANFKAVEKVNVSSLAEDLKIKMRDLHEINDPVKDDFKVQSVQEVAKVVNDVFKYISYLLIALTAISLIVGGVNIMNVMYVAVSERTFEIGLRKAVGASEANIRHQFLFEAVVISFLGAIIGVALGIILMFFLSLIAVKLGYAIERPVSLISIFIALGFSVVAGITFGYYPAKKAASLTPVEALRR